MNTRKLLEIGGFVAGAVLIVFGVVAVWMGGAPTARFATA